MASNDAAPAAPTSDRRQRHRRRLTVSVLAAAGTAAALGLSACTSASASHGTGSAHPASAQSASAGASSVAGSSGATAPAVTLAAAPAQAHGLNPTTPITVTAAHGTLRAVRLVNDAGKVVKGAFSPDHTSWHTAEVLGYAKRYRLTAVGTDSSGEGRVALHRTYRTLVPANETLPYFHDIYGHAIVNHGTYGIGMIPVVDFDESIPNRAAAERALTVTTSPHVDGRWTWTDDHTLHWRPQNFYKPGTTITIAAEVYGKNLGHGLYGQSDESVSYTIGASHISIANARTHRVKVYFGGRLVRNMPTSMGQGGVVQGDHGQKIYLWTMPGIYTVINHENPAVMSSDSYGLPSNSQYGYPPEKVPYSTKISTDGIYLHELDTTVWAQGHQNVSHGCLNLNKVNARWFYNHSLIGDVVKVVHSGGPKIQLWQGGDWSVPWSTWVAGSAL